MLLPQLLRRLLIIINISIIQLSIMKQDHTEQHHKQKKIGYYLLGKTLGQGTFGKVKLATHTLTGQKVAIKILVKQKIIDVADVERVSREIHILKLIRHPSIIQLYEIIQTSRHLFLVMEYVEKGQLFDYIVTQNKIDEVQACRFFKQIISGVQYLHRLNIVHRDLKPENLLIDWKSSLKIVDFGLSNTYKDDQQLKTACGSPCYAAPQMIANKKYHGLQVDIWSCGVILFAMVCGYLPFQDSNTSQLYKKILSGQYTLPNFVSQQFKDLLEKILHVDPSKRYRIEQIYTHEWCKLSQDVPLNSGIIVGYHRMPVDETILEKLKQFDFDLQYALRCIQANKHNHITTTYYLLLKKYLKLGNKSKADLSSLDFDYSSIQPFKRVEQQHKYSFFGSTDQGPIIDIQANDIQIGNMKKEKSAFQIQPKSTKFQHEKKPQTNENRRSNNFFAKDKKNQGLNTIPANSRKFHDLRMYLKVPKKKEFYSQNKKKKQDRNRLHSVYYEPKKQNIRDSQDPLVIRLQTEQSEEKGYRQSLKSRQQKNRIPQNRPKQPHRSNFQLDFH